jgi:hypothetical protein
MSAVSDVKTVQPRTHRGGFNNRLHVSFCKFVFAIGGFENECIVRDFSNIVARTDFKSVKRIKYMSFFEKFTNKFFKTCSEEVKVAKFQKLLHDILLIVTGSETELVSKSMKSAFVTVLCAVDPVLQQSSWGNGEMRRAKDAKFFAGVDMLSARKKPCKQCLFRIECPVHRETSIEERTSIAASAGKAKMQVETAYVRRRREQAALIEQHRIEREEFNYKERRAMQKAAKQHRRALVRETSWFACMIMRTRSIADDVSAVTDENALEKLANVLWCCENLTPKNTLLIHGTAVVPHYEIACETAVNIIGMITSPDIRTIAVKKLDCMLMKFVAADLRERLVRAMIV